MAILSCVLNDLTVHHYCNWTGRKVNGSLVSLCIATLLTSQLIYIHFYAHICVRMTMTANCWLRIHEYITITYTKWTQFRSFHIPIAIQWWFSVCETTTEKEIRSTIDANGMHFHRLQFAPAEMQHSHIIHPTSWLSFSFFLHGNYGDRAVDFTEDRPMCMAKTITSFSCIPMTNWRYIGVPRPTTSGDNAKWHSNKQFIIMTVLVRFHLVFFCLFRYFIFQCKSARG